MKVEAVEHDSHRVFRCLHGAPSQCQDSPRPFSGSGAETIAHLKQNGRITIMFCAFEGPPFILRLYGKGEVLEPKNPSFDELNKRFALDLGVRSIIRVGLTRIQDSCGFGVPLYDFVKPRDTLLKWAEKKGRTGNRQIQARTRSAEYRCARS